MLVQFANFVMGGGGGTVVYFKGGTLTGQIILH